MELGQTFLGKKRDNKKRRKMGTAGLAVFLVIIFLVLAALFFKLAYELMPVLHMAGLEWFLFVIMGGLAVFLGIIGSAFSTYSGLYQAKDNEALLSMPIPPSMILFVRMLGVFLTSLLYSGVVTIPSIVAYYCFVPVGPSVIFSILMVIVVTALVCALSCFFGWVISLVATRLKNKSFVTVLITVVFIAAYYVIYFQLIGNMSYLIQQAAIWGENVKGLYPVYAFGAAFTGELLPFILVAVCGLVLFALVYLVMSKTFIRVTTTNHGEKKKEYVRETNIKQTTGKQAIFRKELKMYTSNAAFIINTSIGTILMILAAGAMIIKSADVTNMMAIIGQEVADFDRVLMVVITIAIVFFASSNTVATPYVALEGKEKWIYMSLPVNMRDVINSKKNIHLLVTMIPAWILGIVVCFILGVSLPSSIMAMASSTIIIYFLADLDMALGMIKPNFAWVNQTQAVKQSIAVGVALFGGWLIAAVIALLYFFVFFKGNAVIYLGVVDVLAIVASILLEMYINKRSRTVFSN